MSRGLLKTIYQYFEKVKIKRVNSMNKVKEIY